MFISLEGAAVFSSEKTITLTTGVQRVETLFAADMDGVSVRVYASQKDVKPSEEKKMQHNPNARAQEYWCHTCLQQTVPAQTSNEQFQCPRCHDCYVELIEEDNDLSAFVPTRTGGTVFPADIIHVLPQNKDLIVDAFQKRQSEVWFVRII